MSRRDEAKKWLNGPTGTSRRWIYILGSGVTIWANVRRDRRIGDLLERVKKLEQERTTSWGAKGGKYPPGKTSWDRADGDR